MTRYAMFFFLLQRNKKVLVGLGQEAGTEKKKHCWSLGCRAGGGIRDRVRGGWVRERGLQMQHAFSSANAEYDIAFEEAGRGQQSGDRMFAQGMQKESNSAKR